MLPVSTKRFDLSLDLVIRRIQEVESKKRPADEESFRIGNGETVTEGRLASVTGEFERTWRFSQLIQIQAAASINRDPRAEGRAVSETWLWWFPRAPMVLLLGAPKIALYYPS